MAEHPSEIVARPAGRGWSRWLAALLFGVLLLLTLLITSWFLRACAPVDPSTNLTTLETPAPPAPEPPPDPTSVLKAALDDAQGDEKSLKAELAALQADLRNKVASCKPVEPPKPPPPPVAKAPPPPPPPLPADRWAQKDLGMLQGCWRLGHDTEGSIGVNGRVERCAVKAGRICFGGSGGGSARRRLTVRERGSFGARRPSRPGSATTARSARRSQPFNAARGEQAGTVRPTA
jgi:hypothetical protein